MARPQGSKDAFARARAGLARRYKSLIRIQEGAERDLDKLNAAAMLDALDKTTTFYKRAEQALTAVTDLAAAAKEIEKLKADLAAKDAEIVRLKADVAETEDGLRQALELVPEAK